MDSELLLFETARVVELGQDAVWIETIRQSSCGSCSLQKGCGQSALHNLFNGQRNLIRVSTSNSALELSINDSVEIGIPKTAVLYGSLLLYLFPLIALIAGMIIAKSLALSDILVLFNGLMLMLLSLLLIHKISKFSIIEESIMPTILRVIPPSREAQSYLASSL